MTTVDDLIGAFSTHFAESDAWEAAGGYLELLHLMVVLL